MRRAFGFVLATLFLGSPALWTAARDRPSPVPKRPTISVDEIQRAAVIGRLGVELGKVVTIEGQVAPDQTNMKGRDGASVLRILGVNGASLDRAVSFWDDDIIGDPVDSRPIGGRIRLAVYETGGFTGLPNGDVYSLPMQGRGFHFRSRLVVVHDSAQSSKTKRRAVAVPNPTPSPY